jgi:hypothetical protein
VIQPDEIDLVKRSVNGDRQRARLATDWRTIQENLRSFLVKVCDKKGRTLTHLARMRFLEFPQFACPLVLRVLRSVSTSVAM